MSCTTVLLTALVCVTFTGRSDGMTCGKCIKNTTCSNNTGRCPYGCQLNFKPPLCKDCIVGFYGTNCNNLCGSCKDRSACDQQTGICRSSCVSGKLPPLCKSDCENGTYGPGCSQSCSSHCKVVGNTSCDSSIGSCPDGCKAGYTGQLCKTQCPRGTSGVKCKDRCSNCFGDNCDPETGECHQGCVAGYQGDRCELGCSDNTYGMNCNGTCDCLNRPCDPVTGLCLMAPMMYAEVHNFWFTFKGGIVGSAAVVLLILIILTVVCLVKKRRRRTHSLLKMHRIQKKLSDNVQLTNADPVSELEMQSELRSRLTHNINDESSDPYSQFPGSDSPKQHRLNVECSSGPTPTAPDTSRNQVNSVTSVSSNYVTAMASPDAVDSSTYVNLTAEHRETVNPYESHKFFKTRGRQEDSPVYANAVVNKLESEL